MAETDVSKWLTKRGIVCDAVPTINGDFSYEPPVKVLEGVRINSSFVGAFTSLSQSCSLLAVSIGRYCSIGQNVTIGLSNHPLERLTTNSMSYMKLFDYFGDYETEPFEEKVRPIAIGHDVWIGAGALILGGVSIGSGAVIASRSVVTKDVPPYAVVAGNPAVVKKYRFPEETIEILLSSKWWSYNLIDAVKSGLITDWEDPSGVVAAIESAASKGLIRPYGEKKSRLYIAMGSLKHNYI